MADISKIKIKSGTYNINDAAAVAYGTCSTVAATAKKVITLVNADNWHLKTGSIVVIKFSYTNTASNPTLNIANSGDKEIWYNTAKITTSSLGYAGTANRPMQFIYDGTNWVFIGWSVDSNTTYSNFVKSGTGAKAGLVPAPPTTTGTTKYLREDCTWQVPPAIEGPKGETGEAAGFGTPTATIDNNVGTPSVTITSSGPNTAKIFNFAFKNLKGLKGDKGDKGDAGTNATTTATATQSASGLMSADDKKKLDGIASSANNYTHPTTSGNKHIPSGGSSGQILRWSSDGTAVWGSDNNTTYSDFIKSGSGAKSGLVPAPSTTAGTTKYLREDGTWSVPPNTNNATAQTNTTTASSYRVLFSNSANDTTETAGTRKSTNLQFNPSTGTLYSLGYDRIDITGATVDINTYNLSGGSPQIQRYINKTNGGATNITNIPIANLPFILDVELIRWASTTDYITKQTFKNYNSEWERTCTSGTWGTWTKKIFTDTNTTYSVMTGATASAAGKSGLVPIPASGKQSSFLRGDGTWAVPYTHPTYTARTGVPTANQTPEFGGTFQVSQPVSDASGHITALNSRTITIPSTTASSTANGLLTALDKTWIDGKFRRYVYGSDTNDTTHNGYYKICSVSTTVTYRTFSVSLSLFSDNLVNFNVAPIKVTIIFRTNAANTLPDVYVYSDRSATNNLSSLWNYIYAKYNSTALAGGGSFTLYFQKTTAYQKLVVDVISESQRSSKSSEDKYQSVWEFDNTNTFVDKVDETGFQVVKLNTLFADHTIGSTSKPIYFNNGTPTAITSLAIANGGTGATTAAEALANLGAAPANHTHDNFVKSGSGAKAGLVPAPSTTAGTTKYLREDGTWQVPPNTNTDTLVKQSATITSNFRPVMLGYNNSTDASTLTTDVTNQVYATSNLYVKPSTGDIYTTGTLKCKVGTTYTATPLQFFEGDANGCGLVINAGGLTIIGGGEAGSSLRTALADADTSMTSEQMHVASDNAVYIHTNCQTVANRKTITFDNNGNMVTPYCIQSSKLTSTFLDGNKTGAIIQSTAAAGKYVMLAKMNSTNGYFTHGTYNGTYLLQYTAKTTVDAGTNSITKSVTLLNESGDSSFPGTVTATTFKGSLTGNASTATSLATARTIQTNLGSTSAVSFNGSANVTPGITGTLAIGHGGTGKTTALEAITALGGPSILSTGTSIPDNSDLNTYITPGTYFAAAAANTATMTNVPRTNAGFKLIVEQDYSANYRRQILFSGGNTAFMYVRTSANKGSSWSNWVSISTSAHTHSYAGSSSAGGAATSADKLNTNAGSTVRPVYFSGGVPVVTTTPKSGAWWSSFTGEISSSGVMEVGRYLDFHSTTSGTTNFDVRLDASSTSLMTLTSDSGTPQFRISGTLPRLRFTQTTTDKAYDSANTGITVHPADINGTNMCIQSGGNMIIGSGEFPANIYSRGLDGVTNVSENMYIGADTAVHIYTNANKIATADNTDYKHWQFSTGGHLYLPTSGQLVFNNSGFNGILTSATLTAARTWTLPNAGGTIALTSHTHNYAGSSSAGGSATKVASTNTNSGRYYITFHENATTGDKALYNTDGIQAQASSTYAEIYLGNNIATGTSGAKRGFLGIYGTGTGFSDIQSGNTGSATYTNTIPAITGTFAVAKCLYSSTGADTVTLNDTATTYDLLIITVSHSQNTPKFTLFHRTIDTIAYHATSVMSTLDTNSDGSKLRSMTTKIDNKTLTIRGAYAFPYVLNGSNTSSTPKVDIMSVKDAYIHEVYGLKFS